MLQKCVEKGLLESRPSGQTEELRLVGADGPTKLARVSVSKTEGPHSYGDELAILDNLPEADVWLTDGLSEAMVRFDARYEYAMTLEDMLARHSRMLFLDARLAAKLAPRVAEILHEETGIDPKNSDFAQLAAKYLQIP